MSRVVYSVDGYKATSGNQEGVSHSLEALTYNL